MDLKSIYNKDFWMNKLRSLITASLWSSWLGLWFLDDKFFEFILNNRDVNNFSGDFTFFLLIPPSIFILYAILYRPQYARNSALSAWFLIRKIFFVIIDISIMILIKLEIYYSKILILLIALNFFIIFYEKSDQISKWAKFHELADWKPQDRLFFAIHKIKSFLFIFLAIVGFNIEARNIAQNRVNYIFIVFVLSNIILYIGYGINISNKRNWLDRIFDCIAMFFVNFMFLFIDVFLWKYMHINQNSDLLFLAFFPISRLLIILGYQSFTTRSFYSDFLKSREFQSELNKNICLQKNQEITANEGKNQNLEPNTRDFSPLSNTEGNITVIKCPKCHMELSNIEEDLIKQNPALFCPYCGAKILRCDLIQLSESELISEQTHIIDKLDKILSNSPKS